MASHLAFAGYAAEDASAIGCVDGLVSFVSQDDCFGAFVGQIGLG